MVANQGNILCHAEMQREIVRCRWRCNVAQLVAVKRMSNAPNYNPDANGVQSFRKIQNNNAVVVVALLPQPSKTAKQCARSGIKLQYALLKPSGGVWYRSDRDKGIRMNNIG
jgi:hypothetical protein